MNLVFPTLNELETLGKRAESRTLSLDDMNRIMQILLQDYILRFPRVLANQDEIITAPNPTAPERKNIVTDPETP